MNFLYKFQKLLVTTLKTKINVIYYHNTSNEITHPYFYIMMQVGHVGTLLNSHFGVRVYVLHGVNQQEKNFCDGGSWFA